MTSPTPEQKPNPIDYQVSPPERFGFLKFLGGMFMIWGIMFVPIFFGGGAAFEDSLPAWAAPVTAAVAVACGTWAWSQRRKRFLAPGMWTGLALGLLHAGWCFFGMW